jgi:hypothetical protein
MSGRANRQQPSAQDIRQAAETQIERLIALLDSLDEDPDLEPSLSGYSEGMDDREGEDSDAEPSLCGVTAGPGSELDLEHNCDDEGDNSDNEASPVRSSFVATPLKRPIRHRSPKG